MARKVSAVLIDLSGTLHVEDTAIPGAVEALKRLRKTEAKIKFVTNTSKESKNYLYNRLKNLGFEIQKDEIFSSLMAARQAVLSKKLNPLFLLDDSAMEDFADLVNTSQPQNSVVVGLAPDKFNYNELNKAFRLLLDGANLIAIHEGRYYKRTDGLALGPGPFIRGLEYAASTKAEVIGKPTPAFFNAALDGIPPNEAVMIGDDIRDDIAGSQAVGIEGFLVKTGKYRNGDENTLDTKPANVCDSFVEAVDVIVSRFK